jgi:glucosamine--fructose-6-phosphate aminotransferase (isomerizing)
MCGIVGYSGASNAIKPILEGLSRLEYRGYDSAGICFQKNGQLEILKREGKLEVLKKLISEIKPTSQVGIGHTRWATHGGVTQDNAHPHGNETFAVVHNGIIENAGELKLDLIKEGFAFHSQTDSEVFLVLLTKFFQESNNTLKSISSAFKSIRGNSAFVIIERSSNKLYCVKKSAPLVCGENPSEKEVFVSSDPFALIGYAPKIYFPEDQVIGECFIENNKTKLNFYELDLTKSTRFRTQENLMTMDSTTKGDYEHFMLKEIHEQPRLLESLIAYYIKGAGKKSLEDLKNNKPNKIHISACGTAWHAGLVIKNFLENLNRLPVNVEIASEFRYRNPILSKDDIGLFISQSGETADTLACQELCRENGLKTYSVVNVEGSTLFRNCDKNFQIHAGVEIGVASTKAFTQQALTGFLMSRAYANDLDNPKLIQEIHLLASRIQEICDRSNEIKKISQEIYLKQGFIFTGRGVYFPIALEGALKLKEIAYVHAEGYAAGELKHGPIALIDEKMVNIAIVGPELYEKTISNIEEVKARKGLILVVGPKDQNNLKDLGDFYFGLDFEGLPNLAPVMVNVVLQFLSYHIAKLRGTDIDKPRNLAKSVTVE